MRARRRCLRLTLMSENTLAERRLCRLRIPFFPKETEKEKRPDRCREDDHPCPVDTTRRRIGLWRRLSPRLAELLLECRIFLRHIQPVRDICPRLSIRLRAVVNTRRRRTDVIALCRIGTCARIPRLALLGLAVLRRARRRLGERTVPLRDRVTRLLLRLRVPCRMRRIRLRVACRVAECDLRRRWRCRRRRRCNRHGAPPFSYRLTCNNEFVIIYMEGFSCTN